MIFTTTGLARLALWVQLSLFSMAGQSASVQVGFLLPILINFEWPVAPALLLLTTRTVSIVVTITALLRGPLMQRASFVQVVNPVHTDTLALPVAFNISDVWTGLSLSISYGSFFGENSHQFSPGFSDVIRDFLDKTPIQISGARCKNCTLVTKVRFYGQYIAFSELASQSPPSS